MFTKVFVYLSVVVFLAMAVTAEAATIAFLGIDYATKADWRATSVAKNPSYDVDGDNVYGTDGYHMLYGPGTAHDVLVASNLPSYISAVTPLNLEGTYSAWEYPKYNNPTTGDPPLNWPFGAFFWTANSAHDVWEITLAADQTFVLGHMDFLRQTSIRVRQTAGGTADSGVISLSPPSGQVVVYDFFEISGTAGDKFMVTVSGTTSSGLTFDSVPIPEPQSMIVVATGLLGLLAYAWRKRT